MQKLILPFKRQMMLAGYKTAQYLSAWGYQHYGVDISTIQGAAGSDPKIYGSGQGTVVAAGYDNSGGNIVVVIYPACLNHKTGKVQDLVARYMHLASIAVKTGDAVTVNKVLGVEGKTKTTDYHLHIEFDTDTRWPLYSPQVSSADDYMTFAQGNYLRKGTDSTVDPSFIFHQTADRVTVPPTYNPAWLNQQDKTIPLILTDTSDTTNDTIKVLGEELADVKIKLQDANATIAGLELKLAKIRELAG